MAFLGACKLALGVVFGDSLLTTLRRFPEPVLGVLLLAASAELVRAGFEGFRRAVAGSDPDADVRVIFSPRSADAWVLVATAAGAVATGNTGAGCAMGVGAAAVADVLKNKRVGWTNPRTRRRSTASWTRRRRRLKTATGTRRRRRSVALERRRRDDSSAAAHHLRTF